MPLLMTTFPVATEAIRPTWLVPAPIRMDAESSVPRPVPPLGTVRTPVTAAADARSTCPHPGVPSAPATKTLDWEPAPVNPMVVSPVAYGTLFAV